MIHLEGQITDHPILIPSAPKKRPFHSWSFKLLSKILGEKKLTCRVWKKSPSQVLETVCERVHVTVKEFSEWIFDKTEHSNPLVKYDRSNYAGYIDYKYMKDVFDSCPERLLEVQWADFGLPDFDGRDSTIWIGTEGSNTSGHQDSYGFNLVTQIEGRKMWVLFPPTDTDNLYPTRLPYEESSVFTQIHLGCPDVQKYPNIQATHPYVVILHPGQTLYVPRHWWHYVESLDPSISLNVWIPHSRDSESHLTESVSRCLATSFINEINIGHHESLQRLLLNPTETLYTADENIEILKCAIEKVLKASSNKDNDDCPTDIQNINTSESCDISIQMAISSNKTENCSYLNKFVCWLEDFEIYQASPNPCRGYCLPCENKFEGCLLLQNVKKDTINGLVGGGKRENQEILTKIFSNSNTKVENRKSTGQKRSSDPEGKAKAVAEKRLKVSHKPSALVSTSCSDSERNTERYVIALTCPLSFNRYLNLMKLKTASAGLSSYSKKLEDSKEPALLSEETFQPEKARLLSGATVRPGEENITTPCPCVCCISTRGNSSFHENVKNASQFVPQANLTSDFFNDDRAWKEEHDTNQPVNDNALKHSEIFNKIKKSFLLSDSSSVIAHYSASSNVKCDNIKDSQPQVIKKESIEQCKRMTNSLVQSFDLSQPDDDVTPPFDNDKEMGESEIDVGDLSSTLSSKGDCGLTTTEVQKLFFESILHPSVVKRISSLIQEKCSRLLLKKNC